MRKSLKKSGNNGTDRKIVEYVPASVDEFFRAMPQLIYKYRAWNNEFHRRMLSHSELFLSSPSRFNDPYDCGLPFRQDPDDLDVIKIKEKLESLAPKQFPQLSAVQREIEVAKQLFHINQDPQTYFLENYGFKRESLNNMYGVASLTPHPRNFLMWSHYADSHRGFVVGFDTPTLVRQNFGAFAKVVYEDEIPFISALDMDTNLMHKLIYTKAKFWSYEDEYRLTSILRPNSKVYFTADSVREVHLGVFMDQKEKIKIIDMVKEKYPMAHVYDTILGKEKFELTPMLVY